MKALHHWQTAVSDYLKGRARWYKIELRDGFGRRRELIYVLAQDPDKAFRYALNGINTQDDKRLTPGTSRQTVTVNETTMPDWSELDGRPK